MIFLDIFLHEGSKPKIGDFGLATVKTQLKHGQTAGKHGQGVKGSVIWMAPEICSMGLQNQNVYTNEADVYSFGIILYEMFAGKLPYSDIEPSIGNFIKKLKMIFKYS